MATGRAPSAGCAALAGGRMALNNVPLTIVGVAEQRFTGITPGSDYHVWLPLSAAQRISDPMRWQNRSGDASNWWLTIIGRLKPGTPLAQAQAVVSGLFRNEMLHGSVPLFHAGEPGGPAGRRPGAPIGGGAGVRRQMVVAGAPAPGGGAGPTGLPAPQALGGNKHFMLPAPQGAPPAGRPGARPPRV